MKLRPFQFHTITYFIASEDNNSILHTKEFNLYNYRKADDHKADIISWIQSVVGDDKNLPSWSVLESSGVPTYFIHNRTLSDEYFKYSNECHKYSYIKNIENILIFWLEKYPISKLEKCIPNHVGYFETPRDFIYDQFLSRIQRGDDHWLKIFLPHVDKNIDYESLAASICDRWYFYSNGHYFHTL